MVKTSYFFMPLTLLPILFSSLLASQTPLPPPQLWCHDVERLALLEFKRSFGSNSSCLDSWELEGEARNCCSWRGVSCGGPYSQVVGLDLKDCGLRGSINSSTSVFRLVHLQELNLDFNDFSSSLLPSSLGNLRSLRELSVFRCRFNGPIPPSIENLTKLVTLDLSYNLFDGPIPSELASLAHLQKLDLTGCNFQGPIPASISNLTQLVTLNLAFNDLHGPIPSQIASLTHLEELELFECNIEGPVPPSVSNLTQLFFLGLSSNSFQGPIFPFISNLTQLVRLDLSYNQFTGDIPPSIMNLIQLTFFYVDSNQFSGKIPYQIGKLTHLKELDLSFNKFHGQIPTSFYELQNLYILRLGPNNLSGMVQLYTFSAMEKLEELILSFSNSSLAIGPKETYALQNVRTLGLAQCHLNDFPVFIEKLDNLVELDLSYNNLSGEVPGWFLNGRLQTLSYLNLSGNYLTGFPRDLSFYNTSRLVTLDLRFNKLQGSLPIPSRSPSVYLVSNNRLSGEIPQQICDWDGSSTYFLDLSSNNFTGELPQCLSKFSFGMLTLHNNNFHGHIPHLNSGSGCFLSMVDLSDNQFEGPLPRSLANCSELRFLNVGNNRINDTFPSWLGSLSSLRVLILRSNYFHGGIEEPGIDHAFPKLQIIDLSHNNFKGPLPSSYFRNWRYMGESGNQESFYLSAHVYSSRLGVRDYPSYDFSMTLVNKGVEMEYEKILGYFKVVDLSSNKFTGEILDSITSLDGLHLLNLSNNLLTGSIPPSLGALMQLEALDLSWNELSGEIPQQVTQLTFLAFFNVSYNNLSGPIPQGKQFNSFENNSYCGNTGLCGEPLTRKCGGFGTLPPSSLDSNKKDEATDVPIEVE